MKRVTRSILLLTMISVLSKGHVIVLAQQGWNIYLLRENALIILHTDTVPTQRTSANLTTLGLTLTHTAASDLRYIASADISASGEQLFMLLHEGHLSPQLPFPTRTQLVQVDPFAGTSNVIYEREGIFAFVLSPDERRMTVGYYEGDYYFSAQRSCVLDIQIGVCSPLPYQVFSTPGDWIDENNVLLPSSTDGNMHMVNVESGEDRPLPIAEELNPITSIPLVGTQTVLIGAEPYNLTQLPAFRFLTLDVNTLEYEVLPYSENSTVSLLGVSPNNQYLLIQGSLNTKLLEFGTGRLVREFHSAFNWGWIDNSTLIIQGRVNSESEAEIVQIDAASGRTRQLASGDAASGIMLIPSTSSNDS